MFMHNFCGFSFSISDVKFRILIGAKPQNKQTERRVVYYILSVDNIYFIGVSVFAETTDDVVTFLD